MSSFTFISMYIGLRSRNPNRIKKIPQNVYGFVYRQSQLGSRLTTLQNDNLSTVDMYRGRKQPVRMIRQSQHGGYAPRAQTATAHDRPSLFYGTEQNLLSDTCIILPKAMEHVTLGVGNLFFKIQVKTFINFLFEL